jgi:hypothetical protein
VMRDNHTRYAGALYVREWASPQVADCEFLDNSSESYGGAVGGGDSNALFEGRRGLPTVRSGRARPSRPPTGTERRRRPSLPA